MFENNGKKVGSIAIGGLKEYADHFFSKPHIIDASNVEEFIGKMPDETEIHTKGFDAKRIANTIHERSYTEGYIDCLENLAISTLLGIGVYAVSKHFQKRAERKPYTE